ncbi:uncharacterized protein LOC111050672 [Nilaparvata lugens]|uniref:uncharacterized protein LOC111050672 n=1 Tax=Nilaparvata lugens TaxID=108931 RepID=UPI00193DC15A|nr:uncharacterized protein LOC111050672 [Nilaparvata lugens]
MEEAFEFDAKLLIRAVSSRPTLWDRRLESYKDRTEVVKCWEEVCRLVNEDYEALPPEKRRPFQKDVINRWKSFRSGYRKSLVRLKRLRKLGVPEKKMKKYNYHKEMEFMRKVFENSGETEDTNKSEDSSEDCVEIKTQDPLHCDLPTTSHKTRAFKTRIPNVKHKHNEFPNVNHKPAEFPNENHTPGEFPNVNHKPAEFPNVNHTPGEFPNENHTPGEFPNVNHKPGEFPNENHTPVRFEVRMPETVEEVPNRHMAFMQGLVPTLDNFTDDEVLDFQAGALALIQNIKRARRILDHRTIK